MNRAVVAALLAGIGGLPAAAAEDTPTTAVTISTKDCARLIRHQPSGDVAYKPGVDARGRKVAAADLDGGGNTLTLLPEVLEFPISVNPVDWAQRNALQKRKADTNTAIVANQQAIETAHKSLAALTLAGTALGTQSTTLAAEKQTLAAALATLQASVDSKAIPSTDRDYRAAKAAVTAKQAEIDANTAALSANAAAIDTQKAIINPNTARLETLTAAASTLTTRGQTLAAEKQALATALATLQASVDAKAIPSTDRDYRAAKAAVTAKQAEIDANTAALSANAAASAETQALIDAGATPAAALARQQTSIDGQLAGLSSKGLDNTAFTAATVRYDFAKGAFTINGQPLGSPEQQAIAEACARRGVK